MITEALSSPEVITAYSSSLTSCCPSTRFLPAQTQQALSVLWSSGPLTVDFLPQRRLRSRRQQLHRIQTQLVSLWGLTFGSSRGAMIHFKGNSHWFSLLILLPAFPLFLLASWLLALSSFIPSCPSFPPRPSRQKPCLVSPNGVRGCLVCARVGPRIRLCAFSTCQHMQPARKPNIIYMFFGNYCPH